MAGPDNDDPYSGTSIKDVSQYRHEYSIFGNWANNPIPATTTGETYHTWIGSATTANTAAVTWKKWVEPVPIEMGYDLTQTSFQPDIVGDFQTRDVWGYFIQEAHTPAQERVQEEAAEVRKTQYAAQYAELKEEKANAQLRAEALLISALTVEQKEEYAKDKSFTLWAAGKRYRIKKGRSFNVEELNSDGLKIATLCAHPRDNVPDHDTMLAQKLMLETAPEEFLRLANRSVVRVQ